MFAVVVLDHRDPIVASKLRALQRAAYQVEATLIGYDQMPPLREEVADITQLHLAMLGVVSDGQIVGVLGYKRDSMVVDIDRLAVEPLLFRRGVGRTLLGDLHHREADADRFEVSTGAANRPAVELYKSMGYVLRAEDVSIGVRRVHFERHGWSTDGQRGSNL